MYTSKFKDLPLVGIMRGISAVHMPAIVETLVKAGLGYVEVTMNTPGAAEIIREVKRIAGDRMKVGAGTVLSTGDLRTALDSGAEFIVTPVMVADVVRECVERKVHVLPGAFTPKEVFEAWSAGAALVKVFPASMLGPKYFKELKGPFNDVKLMAVGGVNEDNIGDYFKSGADAVAFGASVFKREWIEKKDYSAIGALVGRYVEAVRISINRG